MLSIKTWRWPNGNLALVEEVTKLITDKNVEIFVGCDSHMITGNWVFATVICAYNKGRGGTFLYSQEHVLKSSFNNLQQRLMEETMRSVNIASEIKQEFGIEPEVHLDLSTEKFKSSRYTKDLTSMVCAYGFKYQVKPNSWVSSALADKSAKISLL